MRIPLFPRRRRAKTVLRQLDRDLRRTLDQHLGRARRNILAGNHERHLTLDIGIREICRLRERLPAVAAADAVERSQLLMDCRPSLYEVLHRLQRRDHAGSNCLALARALLALESAIDSVGQHPDAAIADPATVVLSSAMLNAICLQLLPPERMAVVAGEARGGRHLATGVFDVTAVDSSRVHVRADSGKLSRALLAMETTANRLVAWMHSHPGDGALATHPSPIDTNQYANWLKDFPALVAGIVTADRHVRFFGDAVESNRVTVVVDGPGAERVEDHVYRLA
jgi:proteasome lid subunit RPN8/RPN11